MLCQICHAVEATVYLIENVNNKQVCLHICESCAQKRHLGEIISKPAMAIHELLASILQLGAAPVAETTNVQCPRCGLEYTQFAQSGRFGCAACYQAFGERLLPLLRQFHQAEEHRGRGSWRESKASCDEEQDIREQIRRAIAMEDYESAARLRDRLKSEEERGNG